MSDDFTMGTVTLYDGSGEFTIDLDKLAEALLEGDPDAVELLEAGLENGVPELESLAEAIQSVEDEEIAEAAEEAAAEAGVNFDREAWDQAVEATGGDIQAAADAFDRHAIPVDAVTDVGTAPTREPTEVNVHSDPLDEALASYAAEQEAIQEGRSLPYDPDPQANATEYDEEYLDNIADSLKDDTPDRLSREVAENVAEATGTSAERAPGTPWYADN